MRLSGPDALALAQNSSHPVTLLQAHARLTQVLDPRDGGTVDEAMITAFLAPRSCTGEDVVEIAAHGSPVVLAMLVDRAISLGARLAERVNSRSVRFRWQNRFCAPMGWRLAP